MIPLVDNCVDNEGLFNIENIDRVIVGDVLESCGVVQPYPRHGDELNGVKTLTLMDGDVDRYEVTVTGGRIAVFATVTYTTSQAMVNTSDLNQHELMLRRSKTYDL